MSGKPKVRHLKEYRGRFYCQRRVPQKLQAAVGLRKWLRPCGDVDYAKAVQLVVTWAEEHDQLISQLRDPGQLSVAKNAATRRSKERSRQAISKLGLPRFLEMTEQRPEEKKRYHIESMPRPWQAAAKMLENAEASRRGFFDASQVISFIETRVSLYEDGNLPNRLMRLPNHPD